MAQQAIVINSLLWFTNQKMKLLRQDVLYGIRTRGLKTRALKDISPKNTIPNGHES